MFSRRRAVFFQLGHVILLAFLNKVLDRESIHTLVALRTQIPNDRHAFFIVFFGDPGVRSSKTIMKYIFVLPGRRAMFFQLGHAISPAFLKTFLDQANKTKQEEGLNPIPLKENATL